MIDSKKLKEMLEDGSAILYDVRSKREYNNGHIKGAKCVPLTFNFKGFAKCIDDGDCLKVFYCESGARSGMVINILGKMGFTNMHNFGSIHEWEYDLERN